MLSISRILHTTVMVAAVQRLLQINSVRWHIFFNAETSQVGAVQRFLLFNCDRSQFLFFFFYYRNQISILQHCLAIQLFRCRNPDFSNSTLVWSYNFFTAETPILAIQHCLIIQLFHCRNPDFSNLTLSDHIFFFHWWNNISVLQKYSVIDLSQQESDICLPTVFKQRSFAESHGVNRFWCMQNLHQRTNCAGRSKALELSHDEAPSLCCDCVWRANLSVGTCVTATRQMTGLGLSLPLIVQRQDNSGFVEHNIARFSPFYITKAVWLFRPGFDWYHNSVALVLCATCNHANYNGQTKEIFWYPARNEPFLNGQNPIASVWPCPKNK